MDWLFTGKLDLNLFSTVEFWLIGFLAGYPAFFGGELACEIGFGVND